MLYYPKIPGSRNAPDGQCIAFVKYDGTNLHFDWDRDFGWHAFGTRRDEFNLTTDGIRLFSERHAHLQESVAIFQEDWAESLESIFREHAAYREIQSFRVFGEFFGENSFAGLHQKDDPKEIRIFDVLAETSGLIGPKEFINNFGHLPVAEVVYEGKLTGKFAEDVRNGKYEVAEGVICKGGNGGEDLWMAKIKTHAYLEKLRQAFAERWEEFWE
ncbi:RNA ligase family protein [Zavarzinella formosa]|uniref:RNA ligase family protein n=1 Tax=Zavarzinella formosa TaxID=360055 RepID=UPI0003097EFB|nr:RNA ligase family protein [Zavarzinella formosa]